MLRICRTYWCALPLIGYGDTSAFTLIAGFGVIILVELRGVVTICCIERGIPVLAFTITTCTVFGVTLSLGISPISRIITQRLVQAIDEQTTSIFS